MNHDPDEIALARVQAAVARASVGSVMGEELRARANRLSYNERDALLEKAMTIVRASQKGFDRAASSDTPRTLPPLS